MKSPRGEAPYWIQWIWDPVDTVVLTTASWLRMPAAWIDRYQDFAFRYSLPGGALFRKGAEKILQRTMRQQLGDEPAARAERVRWLGEFGHRKSEWGLVAILAAAYDPFVSVRLAVVEALAPFTERMEAAAPPQDEYRKGAVQILVALSRLPWLSAPAGAAIARLNDEFIDEAGSEILFRILAGKFGRTPREHLWALKVLGASTQEGAWKPILLFAAFDDSLRVQVHAVEALASVALALASQRDTRGYVDRTRDALMSLRHRRPWLDYAIRVALERLEGPLLPGDGPTPFRAGTPDLPSAVQRAA